MKEALRLLVTCSRAFCETQQAFPFVVHIFFVQVPLAVDSVAAILRDSAVMSRTCSYQWSEQLRRRRHVLLRILRRIRHAFSLILCDASDTCDRSQVA